MKIKIRISRNELKHLISAGQVLMLSKTKMISNGASEPEVIVHLDNLTAMMLMMMKRKSSSTKWIRMTFDANYFLSLKQIITLSKISFDEYYQILFKEFFDHCNKQVTETDTIASTLIRETAE